MLTSETFTVRKHSLAFAILITQLTQAQLPAVTAWQVSFGGSGDDRAAEIQQTLDGGYIVVGSTTSTDGDISGYHGGVSDIVVFKLSPDGTLLWEKCLGGSERDAGFSIDPTDDGGYVVAGGTSSNNGDVSENHGSTDFWVVKLDALGSIQWQTSLGGSFAEEAHSIRQLADGGYIVAGRTWSNDGMVSGNHGSNDVWVVRLNGVGDMEWQKCFGGSSNEEALAITLTTDGRFVFAGNTSSVDGDVSGCQGYARGWVVKINAQGELLWQRCLGSATLDEWVTSVEQTLDGGYILAGSNNGGCASISYTEQCRAYKLDAAGEVQWQRCYGGEGSDEAYSIRQTPDGGYIMAAEAHSIDGHVQLAPGDEHGYWIVRLQDNGNIIWQRSLGGMFDEAPASVVLASDGGYVFAGYSRSNDGAVSGNHGGLDSWVVKVAERYNTVSGRLYVDLNGNALQDADEPALPNHMVQENTSGQQTYTLPNGNYEFSVTDPGVFSVQPTSIAHYEVLPGSHTVEFSGLMETATEKDFAFQPNVETSDFRIAVTPASAFRPGFMARYALTCINVGTIEATPTMSIALAPLLTFSSASTAPTSVLADSVVWELPSVGPYEESTIVVEVAVSSDAPLGTSLISRALVQPVAEDPIPTDNIEQCSVLVTGSFDPNDILVDRSITTPMELLTMQPLNYTIRFQNTGTDTAFTVVIRNSLPENVDLSSLALIDASHEVMLDYGNEDRMMWFRFLNIQLPDSNTNESNSHGFVRYSIVPFTDLVVGDSIQNSASIFFDWNAPVFTNNATTDVISTAGISDSGERTSIALYPNPTSGQIRVVSSHFVWNAGLTVMDALGREVFQGQMNGYSQTWDISDLSKGLYLVTLRSAVGESSLKLVLE